MFTDRQANWSTKSKPAEHREAFLVSHKIVMGIEDILV